MHGSVIDPLRTRLAFFRRFEVIGKFAQLSRDLRGILTNRTRAPASLFYSTSTHLLRISSFAAIAWALHAEIGFAALYALVPVSLLVAMIPISAGSWGVREASVIFFLGWVGVPPATALGISVTFGLVRLAVAAIGGIVWMLVRSHHYGLNVADVPD